MNGYLTAVAGLLEEGAKKYYGNSEPAVYAARFGHDKCLSLLLEAGWSVDGIDAMAGKQGGSLLHVASSSGSVESFKVLLEKGARVGLDERGATPLHALFENGHILDEERLRCIDILYEAGCSLEHRDEKGMTALMLAAEKGSALSVERLWSKGAQAGCLDDSGRDAMQLAEAVAKTSSAQSLRARMRGRFGPDDRERGVGASRGRPASAWGGSAPLMQKARAKRAY